MGFQVHNYRHNSEGIFEIQQVMMEVGWGKRKGEEGINGLQSNNVNLPIVQTVVGESPDHVSWDVSNSIAY